MTSPVGGGEAIGGGADLGLGRGAGGDADDGGAGDSPGAGPTEGRAQGSPLTEKASGRKVANMDKETPEHPMLTSAPPAMRFSQVWSAVPDSVPIKNAPEVICAQTTHVSAGTISKTSWPGSASLLSHQPPTPEHPSSLACPHNLDCVMKRTSHRVLCRRLQCSSHRKSQCWSCEMCKQRTKVRSVAVQSSVRLNLDMKVCKSWISS